jgi:hypothetical protein
MTWAHVTRYDRPVEPLKYIRRAGMKIIICTFQARTLTQARKFFERLSSTAGYLHLTLSLPAGLRADDDMARRILSTELKLRGIPPDAVPWIIVRHTDAACDHYHVVVQLRLLCGLPLKPAISNAVSKRNDGILRTLLCFPRPNHFDPKALPVLVPETPKRRINTVAKKRLHTDLQRVFIENQPVDFTSLCDGLERIESPFTLEIVPRPAPETGSLYRAHGPEVIWLGALGEAWHPSAIDKRLNHAAVLRALRPLLQFRKLISGLVHATKEKQYEHPDTETPPALLGYGSPDESAQAGNGAGRELAPAPRPADLAARRRGAGNVPAHTVLDDDRRRAAPAQPAGPRNLDSAPRLNRADPDRNPARIEHNEKDDDGIASGVHAAYGPGADRGWLTRLCQAARAKGGQLARLFRSRRGSIAAAVRFDDGGLICSDHQQAWIIRHSSQADAFMQVDPDSSIIVDPGDEPSFEGF